VNIVKVNRKDIPSKSDTPIFDYCRKLLEDGADPETRLEIYLHPDYWDVAVESIGEGAKWSVNDNRFIAYRNSHARRDLKRVQEARPASLVR